MNENKNCIISFANQRGNYVNGIARLNESLRNNFDGDFLGFINEASVGAPLHSDTPYAFKIYCFKKALEAGYKKILYVDSSVFAIKNVQPVFDEIEKDGFIMQEAGHKVATWTNDFTLEYFGVTRDQADGMLTIGNAGMLGLNFNMQKPIDFFNKWEASMMAGCFKGEWNNDNKTESQSDICKGHRHDLSCSSIIINQMGLFNLVKKGDQWLQYAGLYQETSNETIILKAQGM